MQKVTTEKPKEQKKKIHLRLKIDLTTFHLTPFKEALNLGPNTAGVSGWQAGFLCFVLMFTKRG